MPLSHSKWTALFLSNFLGIFNDNFLKYCIIFIAVSWVRPAWLSQSQLISMVSAALIVPYLFLSPLGGRFAVIYSKKKVFQTGKLLELFVLLVACIAFYFQWVMVAIFTVFLMGILSCLYSPSKYSLIRDIGGLEGVSYGSGMLEMTAFMGILFGTVVASLLSDVYQFWSVSALLLGLALLGYLVSRNIKAVELSKNKDDIGTLNPIRFLSNSFRFARQHPNVNHGVFGAASFWLIGGMLQMNLVIHTEHIYRASNSVTGIIMACAAIGIALGTWSAGKISGKKVKKGLILIGISGMSFWLVLLTFFHLNFWVYVLSVFGVSFMGGIFQIPCLSIIQQANLGRKLGDMIGYLNLVTFIFVLLGTFFFSMITYITADNSFAVFGCILSIALVLGIYFFKISPEFWHEAKMLFDKKNSPADYSDFR